MKGLEFIFLAIGSVLGAGILGGIAFLWWVIRRVEGMGMGDVKLLLLIGAVLGPWPAIPFVLFVSSVLAVSFMLPIQLIQGGGVSKALPYGPFLAWSSVLYILHGHEIMKLWLPGESISDDSTCRGLLCVATTIEPVNKPFS